MKQFVIIGNSAAGIAAIEAIRVRDKGSKITVISDEGYESYCRCLISYYLAGDVKEENIFYRAHDFYRQNNVELILNKKVNRVDPKKNRIVCDDKTALGYDALLIATGASAKIPEISGIKKTGVFSFRSLKDAKEIAGLLPVTKTACVLGGGLVGLKAAYGLKKRNIDVKVIIKSRQVLSQMLNAEAASLVQKRLEEHGIEIILGQDIAEVIGEGEIKAVKLDSGKAIGCSMIIVGKGVSPNIGLTKDTEIKTNEGILTDTSLRTNIPNIYTAGDVCESFDISTGVSAVNALWPVAVEQGKIAAANMAGDNLNYDGSVGMNSIEFFGLPVISLGTYKINPRTNFNLTKHGNVIGAGVNPEDKNFRELKASDTKTNIYKKIILKGNIITGAIFAGAINNSGIFLRLIREKIDVSRCEDKLLSDNFGYPDIMDLVKDKEQIYV